MNLITPIILIIISFGTFFGFIDPNYRGQNLGSDKRSVQDLEKEDKEYLKALDDTNAIIKNRDALVQKRGEINPDDLKKLTDLLPDNIDNIKLVIDIKNIAELHSLTLKDVKLNSAVKGDSSRVGQDTSKYGTVGLSFSVNSSYDNFQNFLKDLEKSLRLVEVTELTVKGNDTGIYDFSVGLKTYWLK